MHKARSIHIGIKSPREIYNLEIHFDEQYKLEKTLFSKHGPLRISRVRNSGGRFVSREGHTINSDHFFTWFCRRVSMGWWLLRLSAKIFGSFTAIG